MSPSDDSRHNENAQWRTTRWSLVLSARGDESAVSQSDWAEALETLCQSYWYPLYAFLRRKGYRPEDAADLTQGFFASLIEKDFLKAVNPQRGRFRWFLMHAINGFAANWREAQSAQKRGGGKKLFSLDLTDGETRYQQEPVDGWTPQRLFDRRWAMTLLETALADLRQTYQENGKLRFFETLQGYLCGDRNAPAYSETAEQLGLSETAIKVAIHRLREKYRLTIRALVSETISESDDLDDEINQLMDSL